MTGRILKLLEIMWKAQAILEHVIWVKPALFVCLFLLQTHPLWKLCLVISALKGVVSSACFFVCANCAKNQEWIPKQAAQLERKRIPHPKKI